MNYIILKFALVLFLVDMIWIQGMKKTHLSVIQSVQKEKPQIRYWAGLLFYLIAAFVWYQLIYKQKLDWKYAVVLGMGMYATYDLTMITAYKSYPVTYAFIDIAWGAFAFGLTTKIITSKKVF
jgi:uncharacterized membrane protein